MLIAILCALALALAAPAQASATENFANEPPFGGQLPPPLERPPSLSRPPAGFTLTGRQAIAAANSADAVQAERAESPGMYPIVFERGDSWQVSYFTGPDSNRTEVAQAIVDGQTGKVLGAWHDIQLTDPLARGYSGAIAQKVNAPYVWLPLCLLFLVPFVDPRRLFRLLHLDLLVLLGLGVSLFFYNRAEITASVGLTYPVLIYVFARMLWSGIWPRERDGPLIPVIPLKWVAIAAIALACARIALNIVDSHVIDIGVAGVVGADHITHGQNLYAGNFAQGLAIRGDVYAPFNYLAYVPFELIFPWNGHWGSVPAAHAAAITFDLLTAVGLWVLGRRLRPGPNGRALGVGLAFAWLAYPFTLYTMNANANDSLIAMLLVGAMLAVTSAPARPSRSPSPQRPSSARPPWRRCLRPGQGSGDGGRRSSSASCSSPSRRPSSSRSCRPVAYGSSTTTPSATRRPAAPRSASGARRRRCTSCNPPSGSSRRYWRSPSPSGRVARLRHRSRRWRRR